MKNPFKCFINVVCSELKLQDELNKKYPFGYSRHDDESISYAAQQWRNMYSFASYMHASPCSYDMMYRILSSPEKYYDGAYGCFAYDRCTGHLVSTNIVCEYGVAVCVKARNAEEAMDKLYEDQRSSCLGIDDYILTSLTCYPNSKCEHGTRLFRHECA